MADGEVAGEDGRAVVECEARVVAAELEREVRGERAGVGDAEQPARRVERHAVPRVERDRRAALELVGGAVGLVPGEARLEVSDRRAAGDDDAVVFGRRVELLLVVGVFEDEVRHDGVVVDADLRLVVAPGNGEAVEDGPAAGDEQGEAGAVAVERRESDLGVAARDAVHEAVRGVRPHREHPQPRDGGVGAARGEVPVRVELVGVVVGVEEVQVAARDRQVAVLRLDEAAVAGAERDAGGQRDREVGRIVLVLADGDVAEQNVRRGGDAVRALAERDGVRARDGDGFGDGIVLGVAADAPVARRFPVAGIGGRGAPEEILRRRGEREEGGEHEKPGESCVHGGLSWDGKGIRTAGAFAVSLGAAV